MDKSPENLPSVVVCSRSEQEKYASLLDSLNTIINALEEPVIDMLGDENQLEYPTSDMLRRNDAWIGHDEIIELIEKFVRIRAIIFAFDAINYDALLVHYRTPRVKTGDNGKTDNEAV